MGYLPRETTPLGLRTTAHGWRFKAYAMSAGGRGASPELLRAALSTAERDVPAVGRSAGVGWLLVHAARPADFLTIAWWQDDVDLRQLYYHAPHGRPADLRPMPASAVGCVWELDVLVHERAAWITHVLTGGRDLEGYLADTLTRPAPGCGA